jgi:AcrR family transcriptional regulator
MHMSKSGVFAHFGSREDLQIAVLKAYETRFIDEILKPSLGEPRGLPRLLAIVNQWLERTVIEATLGCIWISGASEYDDRPGAVRDELVSMVKGWQQEISRAIEQSVREGHLRHDTDIDDLVFGLYGIILVLHHDSRLMRSAEALPRARRAIAQLLRQFATEQAPGPADAHAA